MDLAHPLAVALGEIVVDGDNVHAVSGKTVEVGGQRCDQRLAFAGLHLGDAPLMQHDAADELNAVRTEPEHAVRCFTHGGKRLGQNVVKRFAVGKTPLELRRFRLKLGVAQRLILVLQRLDSVNDRVDALEFALRVGTEHFGEKSHNCKFLSWEHMNTNTV